MLDENPFSVKRGNRPSALTLDYGEILFRLSLTFRGHYIQPAMALVSRSVNWRLFFWVADVIGSSLQVHSTQGVSFWCTVWKFKNLPVTKISHQINIVNVNFNANWNVNVSDRKNFNFPHCALLFPCYCSSLYGFAGCSIWKIIKTK